MERTYRRAIAVLALAAGVSLGGMAMANAAPKDPPQSGDPRATAVEGNVTTCAGAGLPGQKIDVTSNITENTYIDITAVPSGWTVTGVVVKGGPAHNKYPNLGALPWLDLHAPLVPSGKPAEISHWYVCAKKTTTTTTTTTSTTTSTSPPTSTTSTTSSGGGGATTTTTTPIAQASKDSDLATTGFNGGWFVLIGAGLLLGGGALLIMARMRRRS